MKWRETNCERRRQTKMVERIGFASGVLLILVLMCTTPCTHAQTFLKPTLDFPGYMDVGTTLSITCTCYSNGMTTTIVMARSDSENVDATTSCNLIGGNTYACVAEYTFTVKLADIDVSLSCTAVPSDGSTPKSADPGVFNQVRVRLTEKPVISGPDSVKAGENNTWTCTSQPVRPAGTLRWRIGETESYSDGTTPTSTQSGQVFVTTTSISRIFASSDGTFNIHCDATHETRDDKLTETKAVQVQYPPVVTSTTTTYTPLEGLTQVLSCFIDAVPPPTDVSWLKDNQPLDRSSGKYSNGNSFNNADLTIANIQKEDSGVFVCTATNDVSTSASTGPNVTVTVRYAPRVSTPESSYSADRYTSLVIPCVIDANPSATNVTWKRTRNGVTEDLLIASSGGKYNGGSISTPALSINNLALEDGADYQCFVSNGINPDAQSQVVTVMINYPPTDISVSPISPVVNETDSVTVTCNADGIPTPTYSWYYESNPQVIASSQNLVITSATSSDSGKYQCVASNTKGNASITVVVSVWFKPRLTPSSSPQVADEGSTLTLDCNISSNPTPFTVAWQDSQGNLVDRSSGRISGGTSSAIPHLTFTGIQIADAGLYRCRVDNVVGVTISSFVEVKVSYPPRNMQVTPANSVHNLDEGDALTLTCNAEAEPPATYTWKSGSDVIGTGSSLVISSAGPVDNRNVTCEATNSKATVTKSTTIYVSYVPRSSNTNNVYQTTIGTTVTLTCPVIANPPATSYTWSYGGASLNETGPSIDVTPADAASFGEYTCTATNSVGTSGGIVVNLQRTTIPGTGESTAAAGLSTPILILIILLIILLIIVIIVIVAICIKKGKCKKKDPKGRVGPVIAANAAGTEASPRPTEKPLTEAHSGVRTPQWSAVSRKDVDVTMNGHTNKEHDKLSIEDESRGGAPVPNGIPGTEPVAGGTIISLPDGTSPRPHHLPPVEATPEKKKRRKRKKKHREETGEKPIDGPIDEEEEEEEE